MKLACLLFALCMVTLSASASSNTILSLLKSYNVSQSTISGLSSANISYNGASYTELFQSSSPYLLVNTTNPRSYSLVLGANAIASIIRNNTIGSSIASLNLGQLDSEMTSYLSSSSAALADCLTETGLNRPGASCTVANNCESCTTVPACNLDLQQLGGATSPLGLGIMQFESQYNQLNASAYAFEHSSSNVTAANLAATVAAINSAFSNISSISTTIANNTLFAPPSNANMAACSPIGTTIGYVMPWYCTAIGFCAQTSYNSTQLTVMQGLVSSMNSQYARANNINIYAKEINSTETGLITPLIVGSRSKQLSSILNTTLAGYPAIVNQSALLLTHISNASLQASLATLRQDYATLLSGYLSINLTTAASQTAAALSNTSALYGKQAAAYAGIKSLAANNTGLLIAIQSASSNPLAAALAFRQDGLNSQIASHINSTSALYANLTSVSKSAKELETLGISATSLSRSVDGPFAAALAHSLRLPYSGAVGAAPLFATIPSIIVGLAILGLIYLFYRHLRKANKLRLNRRHSRAWRILFGIVIILVLAYVSITYIYASSANKGASIQTFINAEAESKDLGIVLNGTVTQGMTNCANLLYNESHAAGRKATLAYISANRCSIGATNESASACLNSFVWSGTPFIMLTSGNSTSMRVYSMYGTALFVSGDSSSMNACYASFLLG